MEGAGGGNIAVNARNIEILGGSFLSTGIGEGLGNTETVAGDITLNGTGEINVFGSGIVNLVRLGAEGKGGNISIDAGDFSLQDGAQVNASTFGQGNAGNVTVHAKNAASLANAYIFSTVEAGGVGKGGNIDINAATLSLTDGAQLQTSISGASATQPAERGDAGNVNVKVTGAVDIAGVKNGFSSAIFSLVHTGTVGNGGNITIDSGSFSLRDGAKLNASTYGQGNAGNVTVIAKDAVSLANADILSTVEAGGVGKGGNIDINAATLSLFDGAQVGATSFGEGNAGTIIINVSKSVSFDGGDDFGFVSGVFNDLSKTGIGRGGNIRISANSLSLTNGAELSSSTYGKGDAGDIIINVNTVSFKGLRITNERKLASGVFSNVQQGAEGNAGKIQIATDSLFVGDNAELDVGTFGKGNSGNVIIDARGDVSFDNGNIFSSIEEGAVGQGGDIRISSRNISFTYGGEIQTGTYGQGDAGNVTIIARDRISFDGFGRYEFQTGFFPSGIFSAVNETAKGRGGDILLNTRSLFITNGATLESSTFGQGNAGNIRINAKNAVTVSGTTQENGYSSALLTFTDSTSTGIGGDITVSSNIFRISDGALLDARTTNNQNGGNITVNANVFEALNGGQLITTTSGNGRAGKITVNTTDKLIISGIDSNYNDRITNFPDQVENISANSGFFVSSTGSGITGDIEVNSPKITLDNQGKLIAESASGSGGNINVNSDLLLLRRNSQISTNAGTEQQGGDGGNINIDSKFIVAVPNENSDISANAFKGAGGKIQINATNIFGIAPLSRQDLERLRPLDLDPSQLPTNDITAVSQENPSLSGTVQINTPDADPSRGLVELPTNLVDVSGQIANGCAPGSRQSQSSFIATGRGGLPISPNQPLQDVSMLSEWVRVTEKPATSNQVQVTPILAKSATQIVEAQGWVVDGNGDIVLVAEAAQANPRSSWQAPVSCPAF